MGRGFLFDSLAFIARRVSGDTWNFLFKRETVLYRSVLFDTILKDVMTFLDEIEMSVQERSLIVQKKVHFFSELCAKFRAFVSEGVKF